MINYYETLCQYLIDEAKKWIGTTESGADNCGPEVELFQKAVDGKSQGEAWCFTGDTEIYTEYGWVRFDALTYGIKVAQVNDLKELSFINPNEIIKKNYNNYGWHIKTRSLDIICDKNHRFYGFFNGSKKARFGTLDECTHSLRIEFPENAKTSGINLTNEQIEFLAAFLSDGFLSKTRQGIPRIRIQVSKERKIKLLEKMNPIGIYTASRAYGMSKIPLTTFSFEVPIWFDLIFEEYKSMKWSFVNSFNSYQAKTFLRAYCRFDGSIKNKSNMVFSSRKKLADQLLSMCLLAGFSPNMTENKSDLSGKSNWTVRWKNINGVKFITSKHLFKVKIEETLYCVSVPDERIIIRGRNGTPLVVGNCLGFMQFCVKKAKQRFESEFGVQINDWMYPTEHCMTLWDKMPIESKLKELPHPGCLIVWQHYKDGQPTTSGHIGVVTEIIGVSKVKTIEGNTSSNLSGDQRNGDGVYEKERSLLSKGSLQLKGFIMPWPKDI